MALTVPFVSILVLYILVLVLQSDNFFVCTQAATTPEAAAYNCQ